MCYRAQIAPEGFGAAPNNVDLNSLECGHLPCSWVDVWHIGSLPYSPPRTFTESIQTVSVFVVSLRQLRPSIA